MKNQYEGIKHVVEISTNIGKPCEHCSEFIGATDLIDAAINHYVEKHGYRLLYIGPQSTADDTTGGPYHTTVAMVGK